MLHAGREEKERGVRVSDRLSSLYFYSVRGEGGKENAQIFPI